MFLWTFEKWIFYFEYMENLRNYLSIFCFGIFSCEIIFPQQLAMGFKPSVEKGKIRLEQYLNRADGLKEDHRWKEVAGEGLSVAMFEWEKFYFESEDLSARKQAHQYFNSCIEERYDEYVRSKIEEEKQFEGYSEIKKELENLSLELKEKNKGKEILAEDAKLQWNDAAKKILDEYIASWNPEADSPWIKNARELLETMENSVLLDELYDKESLKVLSDSDSAAFIANSLTEEVLNKSETAFDSLFNEISFDLYVSQKETEKFTDEGWLRKFENEMDKALLSWEEAENQFLEKKILWENSAREKYLEENENWLKAYEDFTDKKESWLKSLSERMEKAKNEISINAKNYMGEISEALLNYSDSLNKKNETLNETFNLNKEIYSQVRTLLKSYGGNIQSWISIWKNKYLDLYDLIKPEDTSSDFKEFISLINSDSLDLTLIDDSLANKLIDQINGISCYGKKYLSEKSLENRSFFKNIEEIEVSKNDFIGFIEGIVENKRIEESLSNEILSMFSTVRKGYTSSIDVEISKCEFHLAQMEKEYEIAKAVFEYAMNTSNLTEKASQSEYNKKIAEEKYYNAKTKYTEKFENLEKEYSEKINALKKEIEEAGGNLVVSSNKLNELSALHSEYDKTLEYLKEENLKLEELRFELNKAEAIYDFGKSIYLDEEDAAGNLRKAEINLNEAKENLLVLKANKEKSETCRENSSLIDELKIKEKNYYDSIYIMENVVKSIENLQLEIQSLENKTLYNRLNLVSDLTAPKSAGKLNLVKITKDENGNYDVAYDITASEYDENQKKDYDDFFTNANYVKENRFNENENYTAAEMDLVEWSKKMISDLNYFVDVALASLLCLGNFGYLNEVEGKNINPSDVNNVKYSLPNVDPNDKLDSSYRYTVYRIEAMVNAYERIQSHKGWENDIARCILYKDSNSLLGRNIEFFENYGLNSFSYYRLYQKYKNIRDDHTFAKRFFGSTFMDAKGKLADACKNKIYILQMGLQASFNEKINGTIAKYFDYYNSINNEKKAIEKYDEILYGDEFVSEKTLGKEDLKNSLNILSGGNSKITENDIDFIVGCFSSEKMKSDLIGTLREIVSDSKKTRDSALSKIIDSTEEDEELLLEIMDLYVSLTNEFHDKVDLNNELEPYYNCVLDSVCNILSYISSKCSDRLVDEYGWKLNEILSVYQNELVKKYDELCHIEEKSKIEWANAEENLNYEYNIWLKNFEKQYKNKSQDWNDKYIDFLSQRQDFISEEYMEQTFNALKTDENESSEKIIGGYNIPQYSTIRIEEVVKSIGSTNDFFSLKNSSLHFDEDLIASEILRKSILEEQKKSAAKESAYQAYYLIEDKRKEGLDKIAELNKSQKDWEVELVRNNGYLVNEDVIVRKVTDGCTLFTMKYQKQYVHMYEDFIPEDFNSSINLAAVNNLSESAIKELIEKEYHEYNEWETEIFGGEHSKGKFEIYLGDIPELKPNVDVKEDSKESSFLYGIKGEITLILMDLHWNNLEERVAYDDFNKPLWDMKIVDAAWSPTLRTASAIAAGVAASIVSCGTLAAGASAFTAAALASAITMANEVSFGALDLAGGYKSPYEIGKSLASSAVTAAVGIATAGVGDKIANAESVLGRIAGNALYNGGKTAFNVASNSLIMNDFNISDFCDSMKEKVNHGQVIASLIYGSVSSVLDEIILGADGSKVLGFSSSNVSRIKSLDSFLGESASSIFEYGYTGKTTLNLASIKDVGLFELNISKNGIQGQVGMNGQKIGIGTIINAARGLENVVENYRINDFSKGDYNLASALRMQYGFGNDKAKVQLESIINGNVLLELNENDYDGYIAKSILENDIKKIFVNAEKLDDYKKLGIILQHEAERNGVYDGSLGQILETFSSVLSHTAIISAMKNDPLYEKEVSEFIINDDDLLKDVLALETFKTTGNIADYGQFITNTYDSSGDYWKLTWGGQLVNDGQGYLRDENGDYINSDGKRTKYITHKTIGADGLETGLLNIINNSSNLSYALFSDEDIKTAQKIMMNAGLKVSNPNEDFRNYSWAGNYLGQKLNMYDFFSAAGKNVNDDIFNQHYNNSVDLILAQRYGVDLGYSKMAADVAIPTELLGKYLDLVNSHARETKNGEELFDKYKFTVNSSDGSETSLYRITKDNPFLDKLLGQHDFGKLRSSAEDENYIVEAIDKYGCNFMATIGVAELLSGNIFTKEQTIDLWENSISTIIHNIDKTDFIPLVDPNDATVNDRNMLIELASDKLGLSKIKLNYGIKKENDSLSNTRICFYMKDSKGNIYPYHFAIGDKDGNVVANPGFSISPMKKTDNMFIGEK